MARRVERKRGRAYNDGAPANPRRFDFHVRRLYMAELDKSEALTEQLEITEELRQKLRSAFITDEKTFRAGQQEVEKMIATKAPLSDILTTLVRMIEAQSPGMLCSVLLLSPNGNHIQHGAAPSLPDAFVQAIDGEPIGPKHGSC